MIFKKLHSCSIIIRSFIYCMCVCVPFQTRTRAQTVAEVATAETVAVNTTDTDTITDTENLSNRQTGTLNPAISNPIFVDLNSPGDSHSTRSVTDIRVMTDDSSAVADVSPTVGVLQPTFLRETLLELNEARTQMDIYR